MRTVRISFNYDPRILEEAGVDLDSGTLGRIKDMMLEGLEDRVEGMRENLRGHEEDEDPEWVRARRELAVIEALLAQE